MEKQYKIRERKCHAEDLEKQKQLITEKDQLYDPGKKFRKLFGISS